MSGSVQLELSLEEVDHVYYSGDRIRGALVVHTAAPVSISGVELRFRGSARARWKEVDSEGSRKTEVDHEKEEVYFDDRFCLWGKALGQGHWDSSEVLNTGRHLFPFQYKLPEGIPCSFEGPEAYIRYTVHGSVVRATGSNVLTRKTVTVLRDLDCKRDSDKKSPSTRHVLEDHAERTFSPTCCRPSRVSSSLCVMKRSYVPGENIYADVQIHNTTMRKSGPCRLQLKQLLTYGDSYCRPVLLEELEFADSVRPGQRRQWKSLGLAVPPTCPSRLSKCRVIDVRYCVAIECQYIDSVIYAAVPITIVTVPEKGIVPIRWSYRESTTTFGDEDCNRSTKDEYINQSKDEYINQSSNDDHSNQSTKASCNNHSSKDDNFRPKYKFYEELRDLRKDKYFVLKLRQSPGVRRRLLPVEGESRADSEGANESRA